MIFSPPRVQSSFYEHSLKTGEVEPKQNCCCFSDANCCKCGCCYGLWLEKLHSKVSLSWSAAAAAAVVASSEEKTWRKTWRSSSKVILRSGRDLPWEEVPLKWKRRETCKGRTVTTTNKPIHHGKKIFSPFHIAQIAGKTCDGGFYLLCFPGNGVKNEPTSWYDRTSPFYFAIRKLTTEVLKNVMNPTQRNFSLLWSKY